MKTPQTHFLATCVGPAAVAVSGTAYAAKTLPTLQHHLDMARELQTRTGKS